MTDIVSPTRGTGGRRISSMRVRTAIRWGGDEWVVPSDEDLLATQDPDLANGPLRAFERSNNASSHTVTIHSGEALIGGSYLARDVDTSVTLAASTADQIVYLGYDTTQQDEIIIGLESAFSSSAFPRIPIWEFDTDSNGVTSATNHRPIGYAIDAINTRYDSNADGAVDAADTADEFGGYSPTEAARGWHTRGIPATTLDYEDIAKHVVWVPSGSAFKLLKAGAYDEEGVWHQDLFAKVILVDNEGMRNHVWNTHNEPPQTGTLTNPLYSLESFGDGQALWLAVQQLWSSSEQRVAGTFAYELL